MDGIHDLGGRAGFGPVDVDEPEEQFHHDWEARTLAIIRAMTRPVPWSIDWFRHVREMIEPGDYLGRPYYDQWLQTYAAMLVDAGVASVAEIAAGRAAEPVAGLPPPMAPGDIPKARARAPQFRRALDAPPRFAVGDAVRTLVHGAPGHTRLPLYARGREGTVAFVRGGYILPDANARDDGPAEPLYTVSFAASALWPEARESRDTVSLDLWESYLEPA